MSDVITFTAEDLVPQREAVLENQGLPPGQSVSADVEGLLSRGFELLSDTAQPTGITADLSAAEFAAVYEGQGRNEPQTPAGAVYPRADYLALFAATVGPGLSTHIKELFSVGEFALAAMLDSCASAAADRLADVIQQRFAQRLRAGDASSADLSVLRYSPGYCGWHISGQQNLFEVLKPESVGIKLRDSFLMEPLKSVSGVLIAGPAEIHDFDDDYPFCGECHDHGCRERLRSLRSASADS